MLRVLVSASARRRLDEVRSFVAAQPQGSELLLLCAARDAADELVQELTRDGAATFGIRRMSAAQLTMTLAAEALARRGLAPLTGLAAEAVAARAAYEVGRQGALGRFTAVAGFPGFPRALATTLDEIRMQDLPSTALVHAQVPEVAASLGAYHEELARVRLADRAARTEFAIEALRDGASLGALPVVLLDLPIPSRREADLLAELTRRSPAVLAVTPTGDDEALEVLRGMSAEEWIEADEADDAPLPRLRRFLFSSAPPAGEAGEAVELFSAPGESRECVEIARRILDAARNGTRFDRMAVFVRSPGVYVDHLENAFRRAGIPAHFSRGARRPDPAGRAFLALLACRAEGLSARRFAEYLSFSQVPELDPNGAPPEIVVWQPPAEETLAAAASLADGPAQLVFDFDAPAPSAPPDTDRRPVLGGALRTPWKWEELLVEAAVIGGRDRWERRLRGLEAELRIRRARVEADEPGSPRLLTLDRDLRNLGHLMRFAGPLIAALDALPERAPWGDWLTALEALASMALRAPEHVMRTLAEMRPMAAVGPVGIDEVRIVLAPRLTSLEDEPPPHRGGSVFVGTPASARGRSFEVVFVPGLAERMFPERPVEDPMLLDPPRAAIHEATGIALATRNLRAQRERLLLRLVLGAVEHKLILSYPRIEGGEGRPRVPSFYGLDVLRALHGELPDPGRLGRDAAAAGESRLAWPAPADPARALDPIEHDLAVLGSLLENAGRPESRGRGRYLFEVSGHLARSLRSRWARSRLRWHPADGFVRVSEFTAEALAAQKPGRRAYSVTSLERYARCPYQFVLATIHRLEPREEKVALIEMDALTRGSMIHELLAHTVRELERDGLVPLTADRLPAADAVLERVVERIESVWRDELAPAIPRVWDDEVRAIRADLRQWLHGLAEQHAEWVPLHIEYRFGLGTPDQDSDGRREPATLDGGWQLHGAIDLIESRAGGGPLRITDYKTGANRHKAGSTVAGGTLLQPALYAFAAEQMFGREVERAQLDFCTRRGLFSHHDIPLGSFQRMQAKQALDLVAQAIETGCLPPAPEDGACRLCDFRPVCGPLEQTRWRRKDRALLEPLAEMRGLP
jgi:ATP-dependent helicase/nuclease subunit B